MTENITHRMVCTGVTELASGKLGTVLYKINEDGSKSQITAIYDERKCAKAMIRNGGIYDLEAAPDFSSAILSSAKYKGLWPNEADRVRWRADEDILRGKRAAKKRQKLDLSSSAIKTALQPLREAWHDTNSLGRLALEVQVLAYLRSGSLVGKAED